MRWVALLALAACVPSAGTQLPAPRKAQFVETEYAPYGKPGTGSIAGQVFLRTKGGDVKYGAGSEVTLNPVTTYSTEWWHRGVFAKENLEEPDPRIVRYNRRAKADGEGRFRFDSLPPGNYFIASSVYWQYPTRFGLSTTGGKVGQRIRISEGQQAQVIMDELKDW